MVMTSTRSETTRRLRVIEGGRSARGGGDRESFARRAAQRRAREAALAYEAESANLLADGRSGFLTLSGNAAADGYRAWAEGDAKAREKAGAKLAPLERKLYLALTEAQAERNRAIASNYAAAEGRAAHAALIDAELSRMGEETWTLAETLAGRVALLEAARPAVRRLSEEKREALGLPESAAEAVYRRSLGAVAEAAARLALGVDPVGCAGFVEAAREALPPPFVEAVSPTLSGAVRRRLALAVASEALALTKSPEVLSHLVAESGMPRAVRELALDFARRRLEAARREAREEEVAAETEARAALKNLGGDPSLLPESLWLRLSPRSAEELAKGRVRPTDLKRASRLARLAFERPGEFAETDLSAHFYDLSPADYALFSGWREAVRTGKGDALPARIGDIAFSTPRSEEEKLAPRPEVLAELGRELKRLTGKTPGEGCCGQIALAQSLDIAGFIRKSDRGAIVDEILTHHYGHRLKG